VSALAPVLEAFFTERLIRQRRASAHTVASYRDAFRLLLGFARIRTGKEPCQLDFADLDARVIAAFLEHLEHERHNSVRSRNARLTAIRSFYRFAAYRGPGHAALIAQVLAIPEKRANRQGGVVPRARRDRPAARRARPLHLDRSARPRCARCHPPSRPAGLRAHPAAGR
jgi:integrase/recombinase XerD